MIVSAVPQIPKPALRIMLPLLMSFTASSASLNNFEPPRFFGGACDAGRSVGVTSELKVASDRLTRLGRSVDLLSKAEERQSCLRVRREQLAIGMLALMVMLSSEAREGEERKALHVSEIRFSADSEASDHFTSKRQEMQTILVQEPRSTLQLLGQLWRSFKQIRCQSEIGNLTNGRIGVLRSSVSE